MSKHRWEVEESEQWIDFPYDIRYKVSSFGRIKGPDGLIKKQSLTGSNVYYQCEIVVPGLKRLFCNTHRIMGFTFLNLPLDSNLTVDHIDGDKLNNRVSNLQLMTYSDQQKKITERGSLTKEERLEIENRLNNGENYLDIHKDYTVSVRMIQHIKNGTG